MYSHIQSSVECMLKPLEMSFNVFKLLHSLLQLAGICRVFTKPTLQ